jgi:predicted TIM-barrel fold metal-dependent hydrolase
MMDQAGIDQAVALTIDGFFYDYVAANNALAEQAAESGGRLIPFCTVDPRQDDAVAELRRCVEELGLRGLKLHPWWQGFSPLDTCMMPLAAEAERLRIPILFHDGTPPFTTPLQVAYLCDLFPDLLVILGHGGGMDLWIEAAAAVDRYANCYVCLSGSTSVAIFDWLIRTLPNHKVTLGTDAGFGADYQAEFRMEQFRDLAVHLPPSHQEAIFWRNGARLLRLDD